MQGILRFDFMGLDSAEAVAAGTPLVFIAAAFALIGVSAAGRRQQIRN